MGRHLGPPVDGSNETVADELEQFNRYVASEHCHHFRPSRR